MEATLLISPKRLRLD